MERKTLYWTLGLTIVGLLALSKMSAAGQQWSNDPWVDHLKQLEANVIKAQEFMNWCRQPENRHEDKCSGVKADEALHTKFVTWDEAMKMAGEKPATQPPPPSLGDVARQFRIQKLQKKLEPVVADFCKKNPAAKICSLASPSLIARQLSEKCDGFEEKLVSDHKKQR
jgi:hypothetical protein